MRVVMVCQEWDASGPSPIAAEAARDMAVRAWRETAPHADVQGFVIGDGGPRSADTVPGVRRRVGGVELVTLPGQGDVDTVMAAPAGTEARWNPLDLASALLGLAAAAQSTGLRTTVVVPVGNADCAGDASDLWGIGGSWAAKVDTMRSALTALDIVVLCSTDRPLLGFHGMSSALRDGREADAAVAVAAQAQEERWTAVAREVDPRASRPMLVGSSRLSDQAGTGAATGLAYALAAIGARLVTDAPAYLMRQAGVEHTLDQTATVAVALSRTLTPATLDHGVASSLARTASAAAVPVVVVAPEVHVGKRDLMAAGVAAAYEAGHDSGALASQVRRVAQTWTPRS